MPSSSSFLKSSRLSQQFEKRDSFHEGSTEKAQSKRNFFRRLLKRSSVDTKTPPTNQQSSDGKSMQFPNPTHQRPTISPSGSLPNHEPPLSPMSDHNKPLPPPPPSGAAVDDPPPKSPVKLDRIIAPLAAADLQKLFSGAPQFFASSEGEDLGIPRPSVAYQYDELGISDLSDHIPIQDEAWKCVTAWSHVTAQASNDTAESAGYEETKRGHFLPRCQERPCMLSMQGLERGTIGFQAALELGVADALQGLDEDYSAKQISEHRWKVLNGKEGVRPLTDSALIERLVSVSEIYHDTSDKDQRSSIELYTEIFTHILHPPSRVTDSDDPYSLLVQIEALISVLAVQHLWFDFSKVEWRIRLGQLLWGSSLQLEDEIEINNEVASETTTQKYWLLLQILLSCELLSRLDMITTNVEVGKQGSKSEATRIFEKFATSSVRWSILLARQWLENVRIQQKNANAVTEEKPATGWLASITGAAQQTEIPVNENINDLKYEGRHQARQVQGLVHFARKINWPNVESIITKVSANGIVIAEGAGNTPIATPRSVSTQRSSYFSKRPGLRRGLSSINDRLSAIIHPAGWLSNSYISGLVLPGESLSHFLISTLLENDAEAVSKLGEEASLYGGFVYRSKSFWSTSCVVGRVLAAGRESSECMGWISSNIVPRGVKEEWVDIDVEPVDEYNPDKKEKRPRILRKTTIEQRGHIIAGADESSVLPGDFVLPSDEHSAEPASATFHSLDLFAIDDTAPPTPINEVGTPNSELQEPQQIKICSAMMRFSLQVGNEPLKEINLSLTNDVYFLTAHPCNPSQITAPSSPRSPLLQGSDSSGHPLHKAFTYTKITLSQLLSMPISATFSSILSPPKSPTAAHFSTQHTTSSGIPKVLIVDCTDSAMDILPAQYSSPGGVKGLGEHGKDGLGSDLEMLGRAVCSERGWNALVSRKGKGCLSCAVREAGAVGWRVILRVA